jgi:hypothetical protein
MLQAQSISDPNSSHLPNIEASEFTASGQAGIVFGIDDKKILKRISRQQRE